MENGKAASFSEIVDFILESPKNRYASYKDDNGMKFTMTVTQFTDNRTGNTFSKMTMLEEPISLMSDCFYLDDYFKDGKPNNEKFEADYPVKYWTLHPVMPAKLN